MAVWSYMYMTTGCFRSLLQPKFHHNAQKWSCWMSRSIMTTAQTKSSNSSSSNSSRNGVWVEAKPRVCLHDVPTELIASGLPPNSPVTLTANLIDEQGKRFCSHAHYITDDLGQVDVASRAAVGGSYTGVFPAGLLTTLAPAPNEYPFLRLYKRDSKIPWKISVSVANGHAELHEEQEILASVEMERHLMAAGVQRIPIREGRVRGTLFLPPGKGPHPGVVDMFGSIGGLMEFRAAMLASRGIAALALAFFAYEDLPMSIDTFDLEYFEEAINILMSQPSVIRDRCGVISVSKSSDLAYSMGTWLSPVKAVVSISGSPIAFDSDIMYKGELLLQGMKLGSSHLILDEKGRLYPNRDKIQELVEYNHSQLVPIEKADEGTQFLVVAGDDDAWSLDLAVEGLRKRMQMFGKTNIETRIYPGAGHLIEPPYGPLVHQSYHRYLPVVSEDSSEKVSRARILWGGNAVGTCRAQEDLWLRMRNFLMKHVRDESPWYQSQLHVASKL